MRSWMVRAVSFLIKEVHEVRRQPLLLISLIGGPFLVLALFGMTFQSTKPALRAALVWPESGVPGIQRAQIEEAVRFNFQLVKVVEDPDEALTMLERGQVDLVQVLPPDIYEQLEKGEQPRIRVYSYAIDPTAEAWIRSMLLGQVNFLNRQMLLDRTGTAQQQAVTVQLELNNVQIKIAELELNLTLDKQAEVEAELDRLREVLTFFLNLLRLPSSPDSPPVPYAEELSRRIELFLIDLDRLENALKSGELEEHIDELDRVRSRMDEIDTTLGFFIQMPPEVIVSPLQADYSNQRGKTYSLMVYYSPRVLALLIQHLAITLGALAIVRERLSGTFEMFRIAPLNIAHILLGKTMAYTFYVILVSAALILLLRLLNVPVLGSVLLLLFLLILLTLASVGIGMLISAVSSSDSQAIQLTMLVLLLSIFFTGFFLPLEGFAPLAQPISLGVPMTHGLEGLQQLMLVGRNPRTTVWVGLGAITALTYGLVLILMPRIARKLL
jgi:ABC-2 type transport system permease protein